MILVGATVGNNHLEYDDTVPVTIEDALSDTVAVDWTVEGAMVVGDTPFGSYGQSLETVSDTME